MVLLFFDMYTANEPSFILITTPWFVEYLLLLYLKLAIFLKNKNIVAYLHVTMMRPHSKTHAPRFHKIYTQA